MEKKIDRSFESIYVRPYRRPHHNNSTCAFPSKDISLRPHICTNVRTYFLVISLLVNYQKLPLGIILPLTYQLTVLKVSKKDKNRSWVSYPCKKTFEYVLSNIVSSTLVIMHRTKEILVIFLENVNWLRNGLSVDSVSLIFHLATLERLIFYAINIKVRCDDDHGEGTSSDSDQSSKLNGTFSFFGEY